MAASPSGGAAPVQLSPLASVESLRGAQALQDAAIQALAEAVRTPVSRARARVVERAAVRSRAGNVAAQLPGMLDGAFEVPGPHEAASLKGQHANVRCSRAGQSPLEALSDGVLRGTSVGGQSAFERGEEQPHRDASLVFGPGGVASTRSRAVSGRRIRMSAAVSGGSKLHGGRKRRRGGRHDA